eukprot:4605832-Alexandrium_andersonii.AAC.1
MTVCPRFFANEVANASGSQSVHFAPPVRACAGPPPPSAAQRHGRPCHPEQYFGMAGAQQRDGTLRATRPKGNGCKCAK